MTSRDTHAKLSSNFRRVQSRVQIEKGWKYHFHPEQFVKLVIAISRACWVLLRPQDSRYWWDWIPDQGWTACGCWGAHTELSQGPAPLNNLETGAVSSSQRVWDRTLQNVIVVFYVMHALSINHGWICAWEADQIYCLAARDSNGCLITQ